MAEITTILLPTRPQPDTVVAIFLLKKFGAEQFPGVDTASVAIQSTLGEETFDTLLAQGTLALDLGGGPLDHHNTAFCTSELVARYLGIESDPSIGQLLTYARRDDKEGKGTISRDAIDRAFGLSGLVASLNKSYPTEPQYVVDAVLPLLEAHWRSAYEHHVELPRDVEKKRELGHYHEHAVVQGEKTLKVVCVVSDKPSMPTYLRSERGGRADVVLQKAEETNHLCILTRQDRKVDLSPVMGLIRLREAELRGIELPDDTAYLGQTGRIEEVPHWYFDPATISLLNGGVHSKEVEESRIDWEELKAIVLEGLKLGSPAPAAAETESYYLSLNIPVAHAERILSHLEVDGGIKLHAAKNLHITLAHFGQKSRTEADKIAQAAAEALLEHGAFDITLHDGQLRSGSPEGYESTTAWYLEVEPEAASHIQKIRASILAALGLPVHTKDLHVTLAINRNPKVRLPGGAVRFGSPVEMTIPVGEVVLMESATVSGKRVYRAHSIFPLCV